MGRPSPDRQILDGSETPPAKFVKRTADGTWEYGMCRRIKLHMEYEVHGTAATMSEAEDAMTIGQPQSGIKYGGTLTPLARGRFYGG